MILSFFEKRTTQAFFGLVQNEEKVVFEQWVIPILVDINHSPPGHDHASGKIVMTRHEWLLSSAPQRSFIIAWSG